MKFGRCEHMKKREFKKIMIGFRGENIPAKKSYKICVPCNLKDEVTKDILVK